MPQTNDALQSLSQSSHILDHDDSDSEDSQSLYPDYSFNDDTEFEDSLHEFTQSTSIEENIPRIGDCDPFDEMSSHDDDSIPNPCNLLDDNSSSPTDRFQDIIELYQCKIFDPPLAKDFVLTLGQCNIFDDPPSDDSCTDLILGECNIFSGEPSGPSDADNFTHCLTEYKILGSSQHEEDPAFPLGKHVPFHAKDIPTLSETLIPPESGYHFLMDASTVAAPAMPFDPMNTIFPKPSVPCDLFSKQFAMNITSCGDADSSTIWPYTHTPSDYEPNGQVVHMTPVGTQPLASLPKITRESHPTPRFCESTPSQKSNVISSHDDTLGVGQGMGFSHESLNPILNFEEMITESPDEALAHKQASSLG